MARPSTMVAWNAAAGGKLPRLLRAHRAAGLSFEAISRKLYKEYGIDVGRDTVRRWCDRLDTED